MNVILVGFKHSGKTSVGEKLSKELGVEFLDLDAEITDRFSRAAAAKMTVRDIVKEKGEEFFRELEHETLEELVKHESPFVLAVGGGTPCYSDNDELLKKIGLIVYLSVEEAVLLERIMKRGIPSFFPHPDDPERSLKILLKERIPCYEKLADLTIDNSRGRLTVIAKDLAAMLREKTRLDLFDVE